MYVLTVVLSVLFTIIFAYIVLLLSIGIPLVFYRAIFREFNLLSRFLCALLVVPIVSVIAGVIGMNLAGVLSLPLWGLAKLLGFEPPFVLFALTGIGEEGIFACLVLLSGPLALYCLVDTTVFAIRNARKKRTDSKSAVDSSQEERRYTE